MKGGEMDGRMDRVIKTVNPGKSIITFEFHYENSIGEIN